MSEFFRMPRFWHQELDAICTRAEGGRAYLEPKTIGQELLRRLRDRGSLPLSELRGLTRLFGPHNTSAVLVTMDPHIYVEQGIIFLFKK